MTLPDLSVEIWIAILVAATAAGVIRGFSGFGSALLLAPILSLAVGPRVAVPAMILANLPSTIQLVPEAARAVSWRVALPMGIAGGFGVPIGVWLLLTVDQELMRRMIAIGVISFGLMLLFGFRFRKRPHKSVGHFIGGLGGLISGAGGIGGPPVVMYLLSGPDPAAVTRATMVLYFAVTQFVSVGLFLATGALTWLVFWIAVVLVLPQIVGTWLGAIAFRRSSELLYRRIALTVILLAGVAALIL